MNQKQSGTNYILGTNTQGASNLDLQHEILKEASTEQLSKSGLGQGMVVWDIGCGSGVQTEYLAKAVGNEGRVYAMDISKEQVETAKRRVVAAGLKNVEFLVGDVGQIDARQFEKADLVYSRFLLMHVKDPAKIVRIMANLLKKGGRLSLQESSFGAIGRTNTDISLKRYYALMIAYGKLSGFDYSIGEKLENICEDSGLFSKVVSYTKNYKTTSLIKELLSRRLDELQDKLLSSDLISAKDYDKLKLDVNHFFMAQESSGHPVMCEQAHIIAYK